MALTKFSKFLVLKKYAEINGLDSGGIVMTKFIDMKAVTKEFNQNTKDLKLYYTMRSKGNTGSFKFKMLKKNLIFI